ncbi:MAG: GNAT family N-acetyltransferase [Ruminococcaceae bacterium]|nr:GNAT family N-acetyltransferase [Oscillospiraceae bacterium]
MIKRLSIEDKEAIKQLFCSVFTREPWNDDWSDEQQLDSYIIDLIGCHNSLTYGMYEDGQLVGLSMGLIKHWYMGTEYYINELCILTEKQGMGLGARFIDEISAELIADGINHIFLLTDRSVPAYNFYKKLGFRELTDTVAFVRNLEPAE